MLQPDSVCETCEILTTHNTQQLPRNDNEAHAVVSGFGHVLGPGQLTSSEVVEGAIDVTDGGL